VGGVAGAPARGPRPAQPRGGRRHSREGDEGAPDPGAERQEAAEEGPGEPGAADEDAELAREGLGEAAGGVVVGGVEVDGVAPAGELHARVDDEPLGAPEAEVGVEDSDAEGPEVAGGRAVRAEAGGRLGKAGAGHAAVEAAVRVVRGRPRHRGGGGGGPGRRVRKCSPAGLAGPGPPSGTARRMRAIVSASTRGKGWIGPPLSLACGYTGWPGAEKCASNCARFGEI